MITQWKLDLFYVNLKTDKSLRPLNKQLEKANHCCKIELGMRLRILWEPHISTQTTLLLTPALLCPPNPAVHLGIQQTIHMDFSHQILNRERNEMEYFHQREQYRVFSGLGCEE